MPDWADEIRRRVSVLKLAPVREAEIVEELAQHVEDRYQELLADGVSEAEATRVVFAELIENDRFTRDMRRVEPPIAKEPKILFVHNLMQDIRYAMRTLKKQPAFTCVVVLTLALGIGVNTAIFSVVNAVLLRPLPFPRSDQLVTVGMTNPRLGENIPLSVADFLDWRRQNQVFQDLAAYTDNWFSLTGNREPQRLKGVWVTAGFFSTLEATPLLGRTFSAGEDAADGQPLVVLSQRIWQQSFGSDPQIVGKAITLNGSSRTVVGVMPNSFNFPPVDERSLPGDVDLWILHPLKPTTRRGPYYLRGIARLKPEASLQKAQSDLNNIGIRISQENPLTNADTTFVSRSLKDAIIGDVGRILFVLFGGVAFVLLIASLNVANLSLSRAASRGSEIAIRNALGAGRRRIMSQLFTESLLLASIGAAAGVLLAWLAVKLLQTIGSNLLPRLQEVSIDTRVLAFTASLSLVSALLFGLVPAWQASRAGLSQYLRNATKGSAGGPAWRRTRKVLVVAEVALSIVLLAGAGLMLNSFVRLKRVSPGFAPDKILTTEISLPPARYKEPAQINSFYEQLIAQVRNLPGVEAAGVGMSLPPNLLSISDTFTIEGAPAEKNRPTSPVVFVSSGYFEALNIPLLAGRNFMETDRVDKPPVVIINESFERRYFPHESPLGKRLKIGGPERPKNPWMEIVGVVGDVKYGGLDVAAEPAFYEHYQQDSWSDTYIVIRSSSDPRPLATSLRQAVWSLDKDLPIANMQTMDDLLSESVARPRFRTFVFLVLGTLAIVLAVTGIYGVISYLVSQRTREIGIRVALGAQRKTVLNLIIRQGMSLALAGAVIGLIAAFVLTRLMKGLLYGVDATDPLTFASITILLLLVSLAACWIPARRAAKVDPLVALREH